MVAHFVLQVHFVRTDHAILSKLDCVTGHEQHEYTSGYAIDDVFSFLEKKLTSCGSPAQDAAAQTSSLGAVATAFDATICAVCSNPTPIRSHLIFTSNYMPFGIASLFRAILKYFFCNSSTKDNLLFSSRCSKCKIVYYCSRACQKQDHATHRLSCKTP